MASPTSSARWRRRSALLFATRILAGIGSGGVFPIALSLISDLVGPEKRQIAIGRTLMGSMTGNLLGASVSGLIGDFLGWRGVLAVLGMLVIVASVAVAAGFRGAALTRPPRDEPRGAQARLPHHLHQPNARSVMRRSSSKAAACWGCFPSLPRSCSNCGETSLSIAGIVIAGFAVGGLFYTLTVSRFLPRLGVSGMMIAGATLVASQLAVAAFGPGWQRPRR